MEQPKTYGESSEQDVANAVQHAMDWLADAEDRREATGEGYRDSEDLTDADRAAEKQADAVYQMARKHMDNALAYAATDAQMRALAQVGLLDNGENHPGFAVLADVIRSEGAKRAVA